MINPHLIRLSLAILILVCALLTPAALASNIIPAKPQSEPFAFTNATIHPMSSPTIEDASIIIDNGKILALGAGIPLPTGIKKIDLNGKHIYPALFDANTQLGQIEINAVRGSDDRRETGDSNPNLRAERSVNPDSELIPVARSNGILLALTLPPSGATIRGTSAVLQLDGWTYEDLTIQSQVGLHIAWPRITPSIYSRSSASAQIKSRDAALKTIDDAFTNARAYLKAKSAHRGHKDLFKTDARYEAIIPVLQRKIPIIVAADRAATIKSAVAFAVRNKLKIIITGGLDALYCLTLLKRHNVPIIIDRIHRTPRRRHDPYDIPFVLPLILQKAKIPYAIAGTPRGASNTRNLPYQAATAASYGLSPEEALKSITLYPARILGLADRVGSLQKGKDATLIITDGNPLEITTKVHHAYIQGRKIDLNNRHRQLYNKYKEKYRRQGIKQ